MSDIVRAWKDESYHQSLSVEQQSMLPTNPAGEIDLTDAELEAVYGARRHGYSGPTNYTDISPADNRQWNFSGGNFGFVEENSCNDPTNLVAGSGNTSGGIVGGLSALLGLSL